MQGTGKEGVREEQWEREERNGKKQGKGEEGKMETEGKKGMAGGQRKNWSPDATVDPAAGRRC